MMKTSNIFADILPLPDAKKRQLTINVLKTVVQASSRTLSAKWCFEDVNTMEIKKPEPKKFISTGLIIPVYKPTKEAIKPVTSLFEYFNMMDVPKQIPEMKDISNPLAIRVLRQTIEAKTKTISARWTFEKVDDDKVHSWDNSTNNPWFGGFEEIKAAKKRVFSLEDEIMEAMQKEITAEIDNEILTSLTKVLK